MRDVQLLTTSTGVRVLSTAAMVARAVLTCAPAFAQPPLAYTPRDVSTPVPIGTLSAPSATCKDGTNQVVADRRLPSDSYIKVNTSTQADVSGQVSGWCDTYVWASFIRHQNAATSTSSP